jgi:hypothetical protein
MKIKYILFANKEELIKEVKEPIEIGKVNYVTYNSNWEEIVNKYCFKSLDEIPNEFFKSIGADLYILFKDGSIGISEQIFDECGDFYYWCLNCYKQFIKENFKEDK